MTPVASLGDVEYLYHDLMGIQGSNAFTGHVLKGRLGFEADGPFLLEALDCYLNFSPFRTDSPEGILILFPEDVSTVVKYNYGCVNGLVEGSAEAIGVDSGYPESVPFTMTVGALTGNRGDGYLLIKTVFTFQDFCYNAVAFAPPFLFVHLEPPLIIPLLDFPECIADALVVVKIDHPGGGDTDQLHNPRRKLRRFTRHLFNILKKRFKEC